LTAGGFATTLNYSKISVGVGNSNIQIPSGLARRISRSRMKGRDKGPIGQFPDAERALIPMLFLLGGKLTVPWALLKIRGT